MVGVQGYLEIQAPNFRQATGLNIQETSGSGSPNHSHAVRRQSTLTSWGLPVSLVHRRTLLCLID
jgi:hypothetical protein